MIFVFRNAIAVAFTPVSAYRPEIIDIDELPMTKRGNGAETGNRQSRATARVVGIDRPPKTRLNNVVKRLVAVGGVFGSVVVYGRVV